MIQTFGGADVYLSRAAERDSASWLKDAQAKLAEFQTLEAKEAKEREYAVELKARHRTLTDEANQATRQRQAAERQALYDVALNPACAIANVAQHVTKLKAIEDVQVRALQFLVEVVMQEQRLKIMECTEATCKAAAELVELRVMESASRMCEALAPAEAQQGSITVVGGLTEELITAHLEAVRAHGAARDAVNAERARQQEQARVKASVGLTSH